jgi:hypothetical protein
MTDDEQEADTFLIDNDPAKLLPFSKRLIPEDPDAIDLGRRIIRNSVVEASDARV